MPYRHAPLHGQNREFPNWGSFIPSVSSWQLRLSNIRDKLGYSMSVDPLPPACAVKQTPWSEAVTWNSTKMEHCRGRTIPQPQSMGLGNHLLWLGTQERLWQVGHKWKSMWPNQRKTFISATLWAHWAVTGVMRERGWQVLLVTYWNPLRLSSPVSENSHGIQISRSLPFRELCLHTSFPTLLSSASQPCSFGVPAHPDKPLGHRP